MRLFQILIAIELDNQKLTKLLNKKVSTLISKTIFFKPILFFSFLLFFVGSNFSCNQASQGSGPKYSYSLSSPSILIYHFAVHPLYSPAKLMQEYQPLINYLNKRISSAQFVLEASRDYSIFEQKYKEGKIEFILPNPWQTIQAITTGYNVIAMAGEPKDFKGIFIVRKDAGINMPSDLIGKKVSYPAATALASCIMPQYFLYKHGININKDITNLYVGTQESSIMNVYYKETNAGGSWPLPWRDFVKVHPKEAAELKVMWETESLINNSVMVRYNVPDTISNQVKKCLIELNKSTEGNAILKGLEIARFTMATNTTYNIVKLYTDRFEKEVRKIDIK